MSHFFIRKRPHKLPGFAVYLGPTFHRRLFKADTKEECEAWAKNKGYIVSLSFEDFAAFWNGRPKVKPLPWVKCPVYVFNLTDSWRLRPWVDVNNNYESKDWRGLV